MYPELAGKVAVITGAGRRKGLGEAMARRLAAEGCKVVITDIGRPQGEHMPEGAIGTTDEMPSPTVPTPRMMKVTGAPMMAPGTAAIMTATASEAGIAGTTALMRTPTVPPMKSIGNTCPPRKPALLLRLTAVIFASSTTMSRPTPSAPWFSVT